MSVRVKAAARWLVVVVPMLVAGCATPYQEMGFLGGVKAQQITATSYRIVSRGNGYTARTDVQDYVLLKAAETTKEAGYTHFALVSAADASQVSYDTSYGRGWATTSTSIKPGEDAYIRVFRLRPGEQAPANSFLAEEIIRFVGSRVRRPSS
jgi:hypothetical protein